MFVANRRSKGERTSLPRGYLQSSGLLPARWAYSGMCVEATGELVVRMDGGEVQNVPGCEGRA